MDYRTKVTINLGLIGVLSLTAVLGWVFSGQTVTARESQAPLLASYSPAQITGVEIEKTIVLTKAAEWNVAYQGKTFPAAPSRIDTFLKSLADLKRERLVSSDGTGEFGFSVAKSLKLLGVGGKVLYNLEVGGTNDQGDKAWVRFAGSKEVWQTSAGFTRDLLANFSSWTSLSLFPGRKAGDLVRIAFDSRIETADKTVFQPFDLVRNTKDGKSVWENRIAKSPVTSETVDSWAKIVPTFQFSEFVSPAEPASQTPSLGTLTVTWGDGSTTEVKLGAADNAGRYRSTDGKREFWVQGWSLGQLLYNKG